MAAWLCVASLAVSPASDAADAPQAVDITVGSQQSGQEAQGSGIILDKTGHVLTNNHVATAVDGGPITVTLTDQRTYKATIVGFDHDHYDIPQERYDQVVAAGAVPVEGKELIRRLLASGLRQRKRDRLS